MAETTLTADEKRKAEERRIDAAVRGRLACHKMPSGAGGCGRPLVPVAGGRSYVHWCCTQIGCSRMLEGREVLGWVGEIVMAETGRADTKAAEAAVRRYERTLKKAKS